MMPNDFLFVIFCVSLLSRVGSGIEASHALFRRVR